MCENIYYNFRRKRTKEKEILNFPPEVKNMEQNNNYNNNKINIDFWTFLEQCYNNDIKIDLGHLKILSALLYSNSNYVSGECLKKCIDRDSRGAVHTRIRDLKILGFEIITKSGNFGGYKLIKVPEWFKIREYRMN